MHKSLVIGAVLSALLLSACENSKVPKCSDPSVVNSVKKILHENNVLIGNVEIPLGKGDYIPYYTSFSSDIAVENYNIINITTDAQLENKRGWSCSATATAVATDNTIKEVTKHIEQATSELQKAKQNIPNDYYKNKIEGNARWILAIIDELKKGNIHFTDKKSVNYTVQLTDSGETLVKASWSRLRF